MTRERSGALVLRCPQSLQPFPPDPLSKGEGFQEVGKMLRVR